MAGSDKSAGICASALDILHFGTYEIDEYNATVSNIGHIGIVIDIDMFGLLKLEGTKVEHIRSLLTIGIM